MKQKYYTTKEVAQMLGLCEQRIRAKLKQGHFPNAKKRPIKYEWLIPEKDLTD